MSATTLYRRIRAALHPAPNPCHMTAPFDDSVIVALDYSLGFPQNPATMIPGPIRLVNAEVHADMVLDTYPGANSAPNSGLHHIECRYADCTGCEAWENWLS
jgi:hypothetical protein